MQNFIEVKNGNPGFQGAWLKPENLGLTEALVPKCGKHKNNVQWMNRKAMRARKNKMGMWTKYKENRSYK